jgi:hypothetical protein
MSENKNEVTNPLQACTDVFVRPSEVFKALSVKDNWSWVPFILVAIIGSLPAYMYFGVVDFAWYVDLQLSLSMPDASPAELENARPLFGTADSMRIFVLFIAPITLVVITAILALYFTLVTRNDEKSIHSFFDWFGAQWWIMMPTLVGALISLVLILMSDSGSQVSQAIMSPTSLGFIFGIEQDNKWFGLLTGVRLETIWTIYLGAMCLHQWTNFSNKKALIVSAIPSVIILSVVFSWTLFE